MKNISSIIKNNFLILGFTGPLASGCTTAARYFSQKEFLTYDKLESFKNMNVKITNNYADNEKIKELKEVLRDRELLSTLKSYDMTKYCFYEISMSTMIIRYIVEYCFENNFYINDKYQNILDLIKAMPVDIDLIEKVDRCIAEKEYTSLASSGDSI